MGQNGVLEIKIESFKVGRLTIFEQSIAAQTLIRSHVGKVGKPTRIDFAALKIFQSSIGSWYDAKNNPVEVGQAFAGPVVFGIALNCIVVARNALAHQEGPTGNRGIEIVGGKQDL